MSNQIPNPNDEKKYDLIERTATFGEAIIEFANELKDTPVNRSLIMQVVRSGTSVGANYMEADGVNSKKDFAYKIGLCRKEAKETSYWLRMLAKSNPQKKTECRTLWKESHELTLIFSSILKKVRRKE
ncbi:MAG: four helix bundle protein [bacterium]|nr:four helix bundle protein [bacterium]